jgi:hypothetical protein
MNLVPVSYNFISTARDAFPLHIPSCELAEKLLPLVFHSDMEMDLLQSLCVKTTQSSNFINRLS